jgi:7,8-dihydropterin-6-yl-methyl-4-(beta-D-ribofuranosyl)aminobenzene 5'-phosphate synthase
VEAIALEPVDAQTVTTLVDNVSDLLLTDEGPAKRPPLAQALRPSLPARFLDGGLTGDALRAEHGFSCLVTVEKAGRAVRVLFDAGLTPGSPPALTPASSTRRTASATRWSWRCCGRRA